MLVVDVDVGYVVLENGGDVHFREGSFREDDEKTCLTAGTIAHDDELAANLGHLV